MSAASVNIAGTMTPRKRERDISRAGMEAALFSLVVVLQRDHHALQRPQHPEAEDQHQWSPYDQVHPERRTEPDLHEEGCASDDEPDDQDHELRRPVTRID